MKKAFFAAIIIFIFKVLAQAQVQESAWFLTSTSIKLNEKFSLTFDGQLRSTDEVKQFQSVIIRPNINYHINKNLVVSLGYGFIENRRSLGGMSKLFAEERIFEQAVFTKKISRVSVAQRLRFEERFIPTILLRDRKLKKNGFDTAYRLRYSVKNTVPLSSKAPFEKGWFLAFQDEILVNVGDKSAVNGKVFDQNRAYGGIGYRFSPKMDLEVGYLNQFIKTRSSFVNNNVAQVLLSKKF